MKYRSTELFDAKDPGAAGTEIIDIFVKEPISRIVISGRAMYTTEPMLMHPANYLTRIELTDGSDVLFSMDGPECQALCIYDRRVNTMQHERAFGGLSTFSTYGLDFGRFLWDPMLALVPGNFGNLKLKLTYDRDIWNANAASGEIEVWAECFDEKVISPIGFLMSKEHWSAVMGTAGTYKYIDLPTDYPLRQILVRGFLDKKEPWNTVSEVRLDEDNMRSVPFNWEVEDYHRKMHGEWMPVIEGFFAHCDNTDGHVVYVTPTTYSTTALICGNIATDYFIPTDTRGGYIDIRSTLASNVKGIIHGWLPHHCVQFPMGDQKDLDDWYDVQNKGSVRLRLKSGAGGATGVGTVILQQLRRY